MRAGHQAGRELGTGEGQAGLLEARGIGALHQREVGGLHSQEGGGEVSDITGISFPKTDPLASASFIALVDQVQKEFFSLLLSAPFVMVACLGLPPVSIAAAAPLEDLVCLHVLTAYRAGRAPLQPLVHAVEVKGVSAIQEQEALRRL